jgi:DNA-binding transcriptional LysR family regulator
VPINLAQLRAFNAVASHNGISAAAQALGVTRPAVAMQIRALEDEVGRPLFERQGHHLELNDAGRSLLPTMRTLNRLLRDADAIVERLGGRDGGGLRIGACAPFVLVPTVAAFRRDHPTVRIATSIANSESLKQAVASHALDMGIATFRKPAGLEADLFHCFPLVGQTVRAIVARSHSWASRASVSAAELAGITTVLREPGSMTRALLLDALEAAGLSLGESLEFGSREAVKEAVAEGLGVGFVLDREVGEDPRLAVLEITGPGMRARLEGSEYIFCHRDLAEVGLVRDFLGAAERCWKVPPARNTGAQSGRRLARSEAALPRIARPRPPGGRGGAGNGRSRARSASPARRSG